MDYPPLTVRNAPWTTRRVQRVLLFCSRVGRIVPSHLGRGRGRSVLVDVLAELEGLVLYREGLDVELFHGDVRRGEALAQRVGERTVAFQVGDRFFETRGQAVGADRLALMVAQGVGVDRRGRREGEPPLDAVEPGHDHAAERGVWGG